MVPEDQIPSSQIEADPQHRIPRQEDRAEGAARQGEASTSAPQFGTNTGATTAPTIGNIDVSSWVDIWPEAYENTRTDPDHSELVEKFERFLENEGGDSEAADNIKVSEDPSMATGDSGRLKTIQKIAEETLEKLSDAHLYFEIRGQPIVARESILKAVQVINMLKPIISGAVATEPSAALAWAGVTTILPYLHKILENIFQQDEDAATGLTNIIFLMARYQSFYEQDFVSHLQSSCQSVSSRELVSRIRDDLVSVYGKIYVYEARFILQYGRRNKVHRAVRNALNADSWKQAWSEVESISQRIDKGINSEVNITTLKSWKVVKDIQEATERIEALQHKTLETFEGFDRRHLLESLQVTGDAMFDSRRTSRVESLCMPNTQREILRKIQKWTDNPDGEMILWLQGMAGTGKTSIALTVASSLEERVPFFTDKEKSVPLTDKEEEPSAAFLGASFFFSQRVDTRNSTVEFFRTIAWCLADALPDVGICIAKAIKDNPGIHTKAPQQQLQKLILDPLQLLDQKIFVPLQLVVVIDALDECKNEDAEDLLGMLANLEKLHQIQLRLFITSRPERHLSTTMKNLPSRLYQTIRLNKIDSSPGNNNDILYYLSESLRSIASKWCVTDGGVSDVDINRLSEKADGLFIYAATACRFLDYEYFANKGFRERRLNLFFKDQWETEGPQHTIDDIYVTVLTFPDMEGWHEEEKSVFYSEISEMIGFIVVLFRPASVETLSHLLPTAAPARGDLKDHLGQLHSIIDVPEDPEKPLSLVHLSFRDFILDPKRSKRLPFSIDEFAMHREVLYRCFELMNSEFREDICCLSLPGTLISHVDASQISSHIPQYLRYACRYWVDHLIQTHREVLNNTESENAKYQVSVDLVYSFLKENLLFWLEVMAFIGEASSIIPVFSQLETFIEPSGNPDLSSLLHDAKRFVLNNRWIIENTPLQMYCSALLFCPTQSLVRSYYQRMIPLWISKRPVPQQTWTEELSMLEGHTDHIFETAFSPTESLLASASRDDTTRVWDYVTGSEKYRFEDPRRPLKVCFSADGSKLASGCQDGTLHVRDLRKGTEVSFHHPARFAEIAFSPTCSNILASVSDYCKLRVWDLDDEMKGTALQLPELGYQKRIVFSPDGQLVAVSGDLSVALCTVGLGQSVQEIMIVPKTTRSVVLGLSISTDHRIVAVRSYRSVDFWEITPPNPKLLGTYEATWSDQSSFLSISPDEMIKICQRHTRMVDIFELATGDLIGTFLENFVKQDPHNGPLHVECNDSLIRILSGTSISTFSRGKRTTPANVEFLFGNNMALSYSYDTATKKCMAARQWNAINESMKEFEVNIQALKCSPDGQLVLLQLDRGDEFQVWDKTLTKKVAVYQQLAYMDFASETSHLVSLSLMGKLQVVCYDPKALVFETVDEFSLPSVHFMSKPRMNGWAANPLSVSPNGEVVVVILQRDDGND
ncbi:hypothetical protein H9Q72_005831 [Fusarium xylarioides]|uniref:NWD NACHT-NTPase N-terminal domain-containing protein n=1 Tax=Fusarium xylarioides TaxID=221167 RepID=A0A9P7HT65_9HYPO|nr:hypothetical protein H9Q72_005831 [Fusarium xylarioides]